MTASTPETFTVNGTDLKSYAFNIESWTGQLGIPELAGENIPRAFAEGEVWVPKGFRARHETLSMWVIGAEEDGSMPTSITNADQMRQNLAKLKTLFFGTPGTLLSLEKKVYVNGTLRTLTAQGEAVGFSDPESMAGGSRAAFTVDVVIPAGFWLGAALEATVTSGTSPLEVTNPATARTIISTVTFAGPLARPKLRVVETGRYVQQDQSLSTASSAVLYPRAFTIASAATWAALGWDTTRRHWLELPPGDFTLELVEIDGGAVGAGSATIAWFPAYL